MFVSFKASSMFVAIVLSVRKRLSVLLSMDITCVGFGDIFKKCIKSDHIKYHDTLYTQTLRCAQILGSY